MHQVRVPLCVCVHLSRDGACDGRRRKGADVASRGVVPAVKSHFRAEMRGGQGSNGALRTQVVAVSTVEALIRFTAAEELRTADAL